MKKLDELQIIKRGNIFKHCFFTVLVLLMLYAAMLQLGVVLVQHQTGLILVALFSVSQFIIEMNLCDIYPLSEKRQRFLYYFIGLMGLFTVIVSAYGLVEGETGFIEDDLLSSSGAEIIMGCMFLVVFLVYIAKRIYNRQKEEVS